MNLKIVKILYKNLFQRIANKYRFFVYTNFEFLITYFFWLNCECLTYSIRGFCVKKNLKQFRHMDSFVLYLYLRNVKLNQVFFTNSPFCFFLQKKKSLKVNQRVFLL